MAISTIDAAIIVLYMLGIVALGIWVGRGEDSLSDYLLGGRDLPWWAILGSIVATETSTATFLSVPAITFADGGDMRFLQLAIGYVFGRIVVSMVLLPLYFRGQLFTAYEVLDRRFGGATKQAASVLFLVTRNLGDGLRLFLAGLALSKVLGLDVEWCIVVVGVATMIYTFFGGMKAVVWSDCIQFVIYMVGGVTALAVLIGSFGGGWEQLLEFGRATGRFQIFDFHLFDSSGWPDWSDKNTFWAGVLGGAVLTLGTHGTDQMMVQRYLCARSQRDASKALIFSGFVVLIQFALFLLLGVALACFYAQVQPRTFAHSDAVFATYIVHEMPVGIVGVTLAAVFSAAMSTLSSSLNSSATSATSDLIAPWLFRGQPSGDPVAAADTGQPNADHDQHDRQRRLLAISRTLTIAFGVLQIGIGIAAIRLSDSVVNDALAIAGFTAGILLGVFLLGVATRSAHQWGALVGMLCGVGTLTVIKFATSVAWPWYALVGVVATYSTGWIASQLIIRPPRSRPPEVQ